jgi:predicted phosphodiesterase
MPLNIPLKLNLHNDLATIAVVGDHHFPYQDQKTQSLINRFLTELQPNYLIYNGDLCDFYQVSVFAKDPNRISKLQEDIDMVTQMFESHKQTLPDTQLIMIAGTHEYRFEKFLWSRAAELSSLSCLTIPELYKLDRYEIKYIPFEQGLLINKVFLVLHGDIASIHSAYTAKRQYEKHGGCGMCNHTHRGGSFYKRDRFGTWGWWENFCTCSLDPDWIRNPNWQQGFSLVHFTDHKRFWIEQIPIVDYAFLYGGRLYK